MRGMRTIVWFLGLAAAVAAGTSCGSVVRQSSSPVYLVIDTLGGIRGGSSTTTATSFLLSDVITNVTSPAPCTTTVPCPTIFNDPGSVTLRAPLKDIGTSTTLLAPTTNNEVTVNRYHVKYIRADGRNVPGVDVPFEFDGASTGTVPANGTLTLGFELVRSAAKSESPLVQLRNNPDVITTIAEVTFYGKDRVGNDVSVVGHIQVNFANFGDF
jgi:hypothetical protein